MTLDCMSFLSVCLLLLVKETTGNETGEQTKVNTKPKTIAIAVSLLVYCIV
jgi:hypothetical protein